MANTNYGGSKKIWTLARQQKCFPLQNFEIEIELLSYMLDVLQKISY